MLTFCNGYSSRVWVAIMFYSPETCSGEGGNFETMGWWAIDPGSCATVYGNDLEDVNRLNRVVRPGGAIGPRCGKGPARAGPFLRLRPFARSGYSIPPIATRVGLRT